ncbi:MAG: flagellar hook-length control protein FliK [Lachnospira sp.]|nr:flagellar hook-length control protein FliK [Lachnospira sp.]
MAINLSNYLNTNSQIQQALNNALNPSGQTESDQTGKISAGNQLLANMLAGETFSGHVLSVKDNQASILLSNGTSLMATLSDETFIQAGQNITFMVEENQGSHIQIKQLAANEQQAVMFNKALEGAGLPPTADNLSIVKELFSLNMPINAETIQEILHQGIQFPETSLHTIANLMRLDIPITQENIMQYEAYQHFENNMSNTLSDMGNHLIEALIQSMGNIPENGMNFETVMKLIETFYQSNQINQSEINSNFMSDSFKPEQMDELIQNLNSLGDQVVPEDFLQQMKDGTITLKQFVTMLLSSDVQKGADSEQMKKLLSSGTMKEIFHQIINETMKLTPQNVKEEYAIPEYYNRTKKMMNDAEKILEKSGSESAVSKDMNQVKTNIDFMNDLNKNMTFFQMPVKFSESEGNGELYVFTNKKALHQKSDHVSALLHLDMEHLGPMDIYVNLAGKNVSTNFCLESEEMLDFVYAHIDELNQRLEKLGYSTHFEMKISNKDEKSFDFEQDFIEKDIYRMSGEQLVFDSRV